MDALQGSPRAMEGLEVDYGVVKKPWVSTRQRIARCLKLVPWLVFLTVGVYAVGVVFWVAGTSQTRDATLALAAAVGVDGAATRWLYTTITTVVIAVAIGSSVIVGIALLLSLVRTLERGWLMGACGGGDDDAPPEPWLFRGYQVVTIILNCLVWLLLIVCVCLLAIMLVWWGGFQAVATAIDTGVMNAEVTLRSTGTTLSTAADMTARVRDVLKGADSALASLVAASGGGLPFTPVCAPVCLNAGSLAWVLRLPESCVCGGGVIDAARRAATKGATAGGIGLAGAGAMWLGSCLLLVILVGHAVTAGFDRRSAAWLKEQRSVRYSTGFRANPKDCVPAGEEEGEAADAGAGAAPRGAGALALGARAIGGARDQHLSAGV
ncbi:hypothetical protein Rsub_06110 [Raphidocelis subcapitata]|uniref:Uncharacterized protein n=1 Tax=Raphidocelis subcapitata TaxID=307507 RepID=A0A2V0P1M4_9CHLO|nr:hypothetical protein Rsub_06110 [Raphidocelis subcapitata]|eukprot:GBF93778.1 hypothetical protein Rsub_06110 [Raphidocelis subcapitata]